MAEKTGNKQLKIDQTHVTCRVTLTTVILITAIVVLTEAVTALRLPDTEVSVSTFYCISWTLEVLWRKQQTFTCHWTFIIRICSRTSMLVSDPASYKIITSDKLYTKHWFKKTSHRSTKFNSFRLFQCLSLCKLTTHRSRLVPVVSTVIPSITEPRLMYTGDVIVTFHLVRRALILL